MLFDRYHSRFSPLVDIAAIIVAALAGIASFSLSYATPLGSFLRVWNLALGGAVGLGIALIYVLAVRGLRYPPVVETVSATASIEDNSEEAFTDQELWPTQGRVTVDLSPSPRQATQLEPQKIY